MIPPLAQKLIPRLASSHDGEVTTTVRMLIREEGLDLHDLARMANAAPLLRDRDLAESDYARRVRRMLKEILVAGWLDLWSAEFVESILERRNLDQLSEKQTAVVNKILRRAEMREPEDCPA
jgi:hypothetical protein